MEQAINQLTEDHVFVIKRRKTLAAFAFRMFLQGVEYSVILPSVWLYLETFGVKTWFLGFVMATYIIASMISMPIVGRIYDNTRRIQEIVFVTNLLLVIGSFVYALPFSPAMPLVGRMLAGLGDGFYSAANGEISVTYSKAERTKTFAILEGGRILGIVIGPCFNFGLDKADFWIGTWHINCGNIPGLFMGLVWIIASVACYFLVYDLSTSVVSVARENANDVRDDLSSQIISSDNEDEVPSSETVNANTSSSENADIHVEVIDESSPLIVKSSTPTTSNSFISGSSISDAILDFFSIEMFTVVLADFIICLCMNATESFSPLATRMDFGWGEDKLSLYYIAIGIEVCFALFFMWYMGDRVRDTTYLLFSLVCTVILEFLFILYQYKRRDMNNGIIVFTFIIVLLGITLPTNLVACKSLITKLTGDKAQGITQGLFGSFTRLGVALGPLIGSSSFHHLDIMGLVLFSVTTIITGIFVVNIRKIKLKSSL